MKSFSECAGAKEVHHNSNEARILSFHGVFTIMNSKQKSLARVMFRARLLNRF
ncbi:hypothetical protein QMK38_11505 [Lysinibacillus fusiformis]|nr:hypothetical protein [Lysinibacillus fusiformis]